jgi:hypothetical protein
MPCGRELCCQRSLFDSKKASLAARSGKGRGWCWQKRVTYGRYTSRRRPGVLQTVEILPRSFCVCCVRVLRSPSRRPLCPTTCTSLPLFPLVHHTRESQNLVKDEDGVDKGGPDRAARAAGRRAPGHSGPKDRQDGTNLCIRLYGALYA